MLLVSAACLHIICVCNCLSETLCVCVCVCVVVYWLYMCEFSSYCYSVLHCLTLGASSSSVTIVTEAGRKTRMQWQRWTGVSDDITGALY